MYEDPTQSYDPEIHEKYIIHDNPFPCHGHVQTIALYWKATISAVIVSLKSLFLKVFWKTPKTKLGNLEFLKVFLCVKV